MADPDEPQPARGSVERTEPTATEQAVARGVAESKATAPHVYVTARLNGERPKLAAVIRASAIALRDVPRVNGAYRDGQFEIYTRRNIGFVVNGDEGSVVPVVHDADATELDVIASEVERLTARVHDGEITRPELSGSTFTVVMPRESAIDAIAPIIQRGQAATLGVGSSTLTLSCDARILQHGEGPEFLDRLRALLTDPTSL